MKNLTFCCPTLLLLLFLNRCNQPATSAVVIPDAIKADADDVLVYTAKATGVCTCRWRVLFCLCSKTNPVYTL